MIISENEFSFLNNDDVKGSWDKAQLIQHAALTSGDVAGSVFANEWDVYTFEGVDTLSLDKIENASLKLFEKVGDEWKAVAAYDVFTSDFSGDLDLDVNKKYVLKVSVDDLKAKEEDQYSFKATLA